MKTTSLFKVLPVLMSLGMVSGQTAAERLEQGVQLQTAEGDLNAAIEEYKAVLKATAKSQRLAAEARYRLAECFASLGNKERMNAHLKLLREEFPADNKWVVKAATLAPANWEFTARPWKDGQLHIYEIYPPNGTNVGNFLLAERLKDERVDGVKVDELSTARKVDEGPGGKVWESIVVRAAGGRSLSRTEFTEENLLPLKSRWYMGMMGSVDLEFRDGKVDFYKGDLHELVNNYDHKSSPSASVPLFENEQMIQVLRTLKLEIGTKQKTFVMSAHQGPVAVPFDLEVTEHLEMEVPAGKFQCAKVDTNLKQTFYISMDADRRLVQFEAGPAKIKLIKSEPWSVDQPRGFKSEHLGASFSVPGFMLNSPETSEEEVYRLQVWSSYFAGHDGLIEINKKSNLLPEAQKGSKEYGEVLREGFTKNYDLFSIVSEWEELEVDGVTAAAAKFKMKKGEVLDREYQVHAVGEELALSFRMNYAKQDEERAIARVHELLKTFRWK